MSKKKKWNSSSDNTTQTNKGEITDRKFDCPRCGQPSKNWSIARKIIFCLNCNTEFDPLKDKKEDNGV